MENYHSANTLIAVITVQLSKKAPGLNTSVAVILTCLFTPDSLQMRQILNMWCLFGTGGIVGALEHLQQQPDCNSVLPRQNLQPGPTTSHVSCQ